MAARVIVPPKTTSSGFSAKTRPKPKDAIDIVTFFSFLQLPRQTTAAAFRLKSLIAKKPDALGIRVGVKKRGCNGLSYTMDYAIQKKNTDEVVHQHGN